MKGEVLRLIVFSHIEVGNYYFHTIRKNDEVSFKLRWGAFVFGNVFPDISKLAFRNHFYEDTKSIYKCYQIKARNPENTDRQRSMALGVVCHYLCDYFCKYHAKMPYTKQSMVLHTLYEVILHMRIKNILFKENTDLLDVNERSIFNTTTDHKDADGRFDLQNVIREYEDEEESLLTDMAFAFGAVREVMKEILGAETAVSYEKKREERTTVRSVAA